MRTVLVTLLCLFALPVEAQSLESTLTEAILDLVTTPRRHLKWRSCGRELRGEEAKTEATRIASVIIAEAGTDLDPWMMAAQLMQESGLNACAFSSQEMRAYARTLGRRPTERDIRRLLTSRRVREQHDIRGVDAGIAQFRWPGVIARRYGVTDPGELLEYTVSVRIFAQSLRDYRSRYCSGNQMLRVLQTTERNGQIRVRTHQYRCNDVYWAIHNSGSFEGIRYQYITGVMRRYDIVRPWRLRHEHVHGT